MNWQDKIYTLLEAKKKTPETTQELISQKIALLRSKGHLGGRKAKPYDTESSELKKEIVDLIDKSRPGSTSRTGFPRSS